MRKSLKSLFSPRSKVKPKNKNLSDHFTLYEYVEGQALPHKAIKMNWKAWNNELDIRVGEHIQAIEELRAYLNASHEGGISIIITAGYRCEAWELYRGRSGNSQHTVCAFDIKAAGRDFNELKDIQDEIYRYFETRKWMSGLAIKHPTEYTLGFVHVDFRQPSDEHIRRGYGARWVYG